MAMISETEIQTMEHEAQGRLRAGDLESAIQLQTQLVERILAAGPRAIQANPSLSDHLERCASQLVDSLRWARQYIAAIELQERLPEFIPGMEDAFLLGAANLRVEGGQEEAGLAQIQAMSAKDPDNYWYRISMASAALYLERFDVAEQILRKAADMTPVRKIDRAMAQEYLFGLFHIQGRTEEALTAWREASRLDKNLRSMMLGEVCRMLIYQNKMDEAKKHLAHDTVRVRKMLFQGLIALYENKPAEAASAWHTAVTNIDPSTLTVGQDAYAEICMYLANPTTAIRILEPLVEKGQSSFERMLLLGLANSQKGNLEQARRNFSIALRLGDLERPRKTMPSSNGRVFMYYHKMAYAALPIHASIRKEIDLFFIG